MRLLCFVLSIWAITSQYDDHPHSMERLTAGVACSLGEGSLIRQHLRSITHRYWNWGLTQQECSDLCKDWNAVPGDASSCLASEHDAASNRCMIFTNGLFNRIVKFPFDRSAAGIPSANWAGDATCLAKVHATECMQDHFCDVLCTKYMTDDDGCPTCQCEEQPSCEACLEGNVDSENLYFTPTGDSMDAGHCQSTFMTCIADYPNCFTRCEWAQAHLDEKEKCPQFTDCDICKKEGCRWTGSSCVPDDCNECIEVPCDPCAMTLCPEIACMEGYLTLSLPAEEGECCPQLSCVPDPDADPCLNVACPMVDCAPGYDMVERPPVEGQCCAMYDCVDPNADPEKPELEPECLSEDGDNVLASIRNVVGMDIGSCEKMMMQEKVSCDQTLEQGLTDLGTNRFMFLVIDDMTDLSQSLTDLCPCQCESEQRPCDNVMCPSVDVLCEIGMMPEYTDADPENGVCCPSAGCVPDPDWDACLFTPCLEILCPEGMKVVSEEPADGECCPSQECVKDCDTVRCTELQHTCPDGSETPLMEGECCGDYESCPEHYCDGSLGHYACMCEEGDKIWLKMEEEEMVGEREREGRRNMALPGEVVYCDHGSCLMYDSSGLCPGCVGPLAAVHKCLNYMTMEYESVGQGVGLDFVLDETKFHSNYCHELNFDCLTIIDEECSTLVLSGGSAFDGEFMKTTIVSNGKPVYKNLAGVRYHYINDGWMFQSADEKAMLSPQTITDEELVHETNFIYIDETSFLVQTLSVTCKPTDVVKDECMCSSYWTDPETPGCEREQVGCPTEICDDDTKRWCIIADNNCQPGEGIYLDEDWMYCDDDTPVYGDDDPVECPTYDCPQGNDCGEGKFIDSGTDKDGCFWCGCTKVCDQSAMDSECGCPNGKTIAKHMDGPDVGAYLCLEGSCVKENKDGEKMCYYMDNMEESGPPIEIMNIEIPDLGRRRASEVIAIEPMEPIQFVSTDMCEKYVLSCEEESKCCESGFEDSKGRCMDECSGECAVGVTMDGCTVCMCAEEPCCESGWEDGDGKCMDECSGFCPIGVTEAGCQVCMCPEDPCANVPCPEILCMVGYTIVREEPAEGECCPNLRCEPEKTPLDLCMEFECEGEGACLLIEKDGTYGCEIDPEYFTDAEVCKGDDGLYCPDYMPKPIEECDGKTEGNHNCYCPDGFMKSEVKMVYEEYDDIVFVGKDGDRRRRTAIRGEYMMCAEGHCMADKLERSELQGGMSLYYECLDPHTQERYAGRTAVDTEYEMESSTHCDDLTFECVPEVICMMPICPTGCPNGLLRGKDEMGCDTCDCKPEETCLDMDFGCPMPQECTSGRIQLFQDTAGKTSCSCADECKPVLCKMHCEHGFAVDSTGCEVCECVETPCECEKSWYTEDQFVCKDGDMKRQVMAKSDCDETLVCPVSKYTCANSDREVYDAEYIGGCPYAGCAPIYDSMCPEGSKVGTKDMQCEESYDPCCGTINCPCCVSDDDPTQCVDFNPCWDKLCLDLEPICMYGELVEVEDEDDSECACPPTKICNCDKFEWPPKDQPFCNDASDCKKGQMCGGCQSSMCSCDGICLADCRSYCMDDPDYTPWSTECEETMEWTTCEMKALDTSFIVDMSSSVIDEDRELLKQFVLTVLKNSGDSEHLQTSLLQFATASVVSMPFGEAFGLEENVLKMEEMWNSDIFGATFTSRALEHYLNDVKPNRIHLEDRSMEHVVLITDGAPTMGQGVESIFEQFNAATERDMVTVVLIGAALGAMEQFELLNANIVTVRSFADLNCIACDKEEVNKCDGTAGDLECMCEKGEKVKLELVEEMVGGNRRRAAVQGDELYCPENTCIVDKENEEGMVGPIGMFKECYHLETKERLDATVVNYLFDDNYHVEEGMHQMDCLEVMYVCMDVDKTGCVPSGGTSIEGDECIFPFMYLGIEYNTCTTINNDDTPWCYTDITENPRWGNCPDNEKCKSTTMDKCDGKTMGNHECTCPEGYMKTEMPMEIMEIEKDDRRRGAIMGEVLSCPEDHCLVEKEEETEMVGGMDLDYECLNVHTGERVEGRSTVDLTFETQSVFCADLVYGCEEESGTVDDQCKDACGAPCIVPCEEGMMCATVMYYCQPDGTCGMNSEPDCESPPTLKPTEGLDDQCKDSCGTPCIVPCEEGMMCPTVMYYCQPDGTCGMNSEPDCEKCLSAEGDNVLAPIRSVVGMDIGSCEKMMMQEKVSCHQTLEQGLSDLGTNRFMFLVIDEMTDLSVYLEDLCPCQCGAPTLKPTEGRTRPPTLLPTEIPVCQDGEQDTTNPCEPKDCWNGVWHQMIIDCQEGLAPWTCKSGVFIPAPEGECCSTCYEEPECPEEPPMEGPCKIDGQICEYEPQWCPGSLDPIHVTTSYCAEGEWMTMMVGLLCEPVEGCMMGNCPGPSQECSEYGKLTPKWGGEDRCCPEFDCCEMAFCPVKPYCGRGTMPIETYNDEDPCCPHYECPDECDGIMCGMGMPFCGEDVDAVPVENPDEPCCPTYQCPDDNDTGSDSGDEEDCTDVICPPNMPWCGMNVLPELHENPENPCCPIMRCPDIVDVCATVRCAAPEMVECKDEVEPMLVDVDEDGCCQTYKCPVEDTCSGMVGKYECTCDYGMKIVSPVFEIELVGDRRRTAVRGEASYCGPTQCMIEQKQEAGLSGPQHMFYDCYDWSTGEVTDVIYKVGEEAEEGEHTMMCTDMAFDCLMMACPEDAKLCDDGETVLVRDPMNNCEFPKCPGEEEDKDEKDDIMKLCMEHECLEEGACLLIERDGTYGCDIDPEHFTSAEVCKSDTGYFCQDYMTMKCDGKTEGNHDCMCPKGYMKSEVDMMKYEEYDEEGKEEMEANDNRRRRTAILGEVLYCREGSCLAEKEEETEMRGGMNLLYDCLDVTTGERTEGRSIVDTTLEMTGSPHCSDLTFECVEDYSEYMCDGTPGDVECKCMEEYEMKKQISYRRRRRTAIMGEMLHCPEMNCLVEKDMDENEMMVGPLTLFYECLNMETGENMEATSYNMNDRRRNLSEDEKYTSYCTDVAFVCEPMRVPEFTETSCDEYMHDTEMMINCLKNEIHVLGLRTEGMEQRTMEHCTNTCEAVKLDIQAILGDAEVEETEGSSRGD